MAPNSSEVCEREPRASREAEAADGLGATITTEDPPIPYEVSDRIVSYLKSDAPLSIGGPGGVIGELERALRAFVGVDHVITFNSGTSALLAAYVGLNLPIGSEVIAPALTFQSSITPAFWCGLVPVIVDVDARSGNISVDAIEDAITDRTSCVVVTHLWGNPAEIDRIQTLCTQRGIALIEDCSHAYASTYRGRKVGTFGDVAVFSMQRSKLVTAGEGGFLATKRADVYERSSLAGHFGPQARERVPKGEWTHLTDVGLGLKHRLHPLAAVVALCSLDSLPARIEAHRAWQGGIATLLDGHEYIEQPAVATDSTVDAWYRYRPTLSGEGTSQLVGRRIDTAEFLEVAAGVGLPFGRPSLPPLPDLPIFAARVPLESTRQWTPRVARPLAGLNEYQKNVLSFPLTPYSQATPSPSMHDRMSKLRSSLAASGRRC